MGPPGGPCAGRVGPWGLRNRTIGPEAPWLRRRGIWIGQRIQYGIRVTSFITATIAALVVAKVVLIADMIPLINRFPDRPLMYMEIVASTHSGLTTEEVEKIVKD